MASRRQNHLESDSDGEPRVSRRSVLAAGVAAAGTSLFGISSRRSLAQTTEQPLPTEDVPEGTGCEVCGMKVKNFPVGNTQILLSDGERGFFCSPSCLTAYYAMPNSDEFADPADFGVDERNNMIESAWVRDYTTDDNIDAFDAYYVLDNNPDNLKSGIPMGNNPVPFGNKQDAQEYAGSHDLKKSDIDVINQEIVQGLDEFEFKLANVFSKLLPNFESPVDDVSNEVWTVVTEDDELGLGNLGKAIRDYQENGQINGVNISLGDLGRLIRYYR
jgi:nitrous oxide reductase accessory protein NosL